ncbi:cation:proton antiporter [Companilactobacillus ginsenosidimutans]|uniref:Sodium:proton antiporter n=1 Tax=Companilactobacillus ginsenosidimutans TaxID=1007676 RepID=A0A0H4QN92_9LACO|nr:sodium:proton antiporter [Companilactobacillus ginsenosidimutans]AKP68228.1 sodium:proton antiporter [Companilactobacillus ginsenosidimutans]
MNTVFLVLLLVAAVVAANALYTRFSIVPVAFLQIGAGLILSLFPIYKHFELEPEVFLLVIISVLMFNDGQKTSLRRLTHEFGTTFSLSVELAIVSILIIGFLTHLVLPSLSLALAFALGAIITPTDPVAVSSITNKVMVPTEVMSTLENESLFNDASGIVAMNLAIGAAVTGQFSVWNGIGNFLFVFFGGIIVGAILGSIIVRGRIFLINSSVDTPSVIVPYTLLTPFVVYLIAEALGVSGILAVVVTGLIHGVQQDRLRLTSSKLQIVMSSTWSIIASILNGIVFILLGLSLPRVIISLHRRGTGSILLLVAIGVLLYLVMTLLRYLWTKLDFAKIRAWDKHDKNSNSVVIALSGVHGTITLAMAFSLPLTLDGNAFTFRTDIIFIASVVIITSLLIPTLVLPLMLPKQVSKVSEKDLTVAKDKMVNNAFQTIKSIHGNEPGILEVINILDGQRTVDGHVNRSKLSDIFSKCFELEEESINQSLDKEEISSLDAQLFMRVAQSTNLRYQQNGFQRWRLFFKFKVGTRFSPSKKSRQFRKQLRQFKPRSGTSREEMIKRNRQMWSNMQTIEKKPYSIVSNYLMKNPDNYDTKEISIVSRAYDERHRRLSGSSGESIIEAQNELLIKAFQYEYNFIQAQVASKKYNSELGNELYEQISTDQLVYMQSINEA